MTSLLNRQNATVFSHNLVFSFGQKTPKRINLSKVQSFCPGKGPSGPTCDPVSDTDLVEVGVEVAHHHIEARRHPARAHLQLEHGPRVDRGDVLRALRHHRRGPENRYVCVCVCEGGGLNVCAGRWEGRTKGFASPPTAT